MSNNSSGILKLIQFLLDRNVKRSKKLLFLLPVLYFFSPITLIPYLLFPIVGWLDNIIVTTLLIIFLKRMLANYEPYSSVNKKKDKKYNKNTIDLKKDDYEVKDPN